jgi:hypothetical protein
VSGVGRIGEIAETVLEGNIAVNIAAQVSDGGVPEICGINALRKQRKGAEKIQVLRVGIQAQRGLNFAATNAKPTLGAVIRDGPVQGGVILSRA